VNKITFSALVFWTFYNSVIVTGVLFWIKASLVQFAWGLVPIAIFTCLMMAVTVGSQNKEINN
jgi:hypothetical protein